MPARCSAITVVEENAPRLVHGSSGGMCQESLGHVEVLEKELFFPREPEQGGQDRFDQNGGAHEFSVLEDDPYCRRTPVGVADKVYRSLTPMLYDSSDQ